MTLLKYEIYRRWRWLVLRYAALIVIGATLLNRVSSPAYQYEFIGESIGKFALTSLVIFIIIIVEGINMLKEDHKKYSGILSVGIFILLAYLIEKVYYGPFLNQIKHISVEIGSRSNINLLSGGYTAVFLNIILTAIFFTATVYLLEKKINI